VSDQCLIKICSHSDQAEKAFLQGKNFEKSLVASFSTAIIFLKRKKGG